MTQFTEQIGRMPEIDLSTSGNQVGFAVKTMLQNPLMMMHGVYDALRDNDMHVAYDVLASLANNYYEQGHGMYKMVLQGGKEVVVVYSPDIMDEMIRKEPYPQNAIDKGPMGISTRAMTGKDSVEPILGLRQTWEDYIGSIISYIDTNLAKNIDGKITQARQRWFREIGGDVIGSMEIKLANFNVILEKTLPTIQWTPERVREVVKELDDIGKLGGDVFFGAMLASNEAIADPVSHFEKAKIVNEATASLFEKLYSWRNVRSETDILTTLENGIPGKSQPMVHEGSRRASALNFWYASAHTITALTGMLYYQFSQNHDLFRNINPDLQGKAIAHEGVRLVSPLPLTMRASTDVTTLANNYLEKDTQIIVLIRWPMTHPAYISNPRQFRLDRPEHEIEIAKRAFGYGGQGVGNRFCLGYGTVMHLVNTDIKYLQSNFDHLELLSGNGDPGLFNGTMDMNCQYQLVKK